MSLRLSPTRHPLDKRAARERCDWASPWSESPSRLRPGEARSLRKRVRRPRRPWRVTQQLGARGVAALVDRLDYWLTQSRLWVLEVVYCPSRRTVIDEMREASQQGCRNQVLESQAASSRSGTVATDKDKDAVSERELAMRAGVIERLRRWWLTGRSNARLSPVRWRPAAEDR